MIEALDEEECRALLSATTVGRVGFRHEGRIEIIPVNYLIDGADIVFRTQADGILSRLDEQESIAFEVDHHDDLSGVAWSVLLSGSAEAIPPEEAGRLPGVDRVQPWAGGARSLWLRLVASRISGRRVRRRRNE